MMMTKSKFPPQAKAVHFYDAPQVGRVVRVSMEGPAGQVKGFDMRIDFPLVEGGYLVAEARLAELIKQLRMSFSMVDRAFDE